MAAPKKRRSTHKRLIRKDLIKKNLIKNSLNKFKSKYYSSKTLDLSMYNEEYLFSNISSHLEGVCHIIHSKNNNCLECYSEDISLFLNHKRHLNKNLEF